MKATISGRWKLSLIIATHVTFFFIIDLNLNLKKCFFKTFILYQDCNFITASNKNDQLKKETNNFFQCKSCIKLNEKWKNACRSKFCELIRMVLTQFIQNRTQDGFYVNLWWKEKPLPTFRKNDGLVRKVIITINGKDYTRPITRLAPLEYNVNEDEIL